MDGCLRRLQGKTPHASGTLKPAGSSARSKGIGKCDRVLVVGTPLYRQKYENGDPMRGYVAAAEGDLIGNRMLGTEASKVSVLPLLLAGTVESSLPQLLHGRVYADFRDTQAYFATAFDLLLSLYEIPPQHQAVADLRESLRTPDLR
jgi:hypothetical protein